MPDSIKNITDNEFESEVLQSKTPVLVDFWAPWCGPCKMIAPVLEEIAQDFIGKLKIVKMNVDENPVKPAEYAVRGIPTLLLFKDGNLTATKVGAMTKSQLATFLDGSL